MSLLNKLMARLRETEGALEDDLSSADESPWVLRVEAASHAGSELGRALADGVNIDAGRLWSGLADRYQENLTLSVSVGSGGLVPWEIVAGSAFERIGTSLRSAAIETFNRVSGEEYSKMVVLGDEPGDGEHFKVVMVDDEFELGLIGPPQKS